MPDKKLTDAEIVKALDALSKELLLGEYFCVAMDSKLNISILLMQTIEFINRQKAEIERLQKENNHFADIGKMYSEIKAEAIKEFADMLKNDWIDNLYYSEDVDVFDWIDNLAKEMGGCRWEQITLSPTL